MRIIHFSDFHLQGGKTLVFHKINAKKLKNALLEIHKLSNIDVIVFGGDLVDCGGKSFGNLAEAFDDFESIVLKPLIDELGVSKEHIVLVPGNHDKDVQNLKESDNLMKKLGMESKVFRFLANSSDDDANIKGMKDFYNFRDAFYEECMSYQKSDTGFYSVVKYNIDEKKVGFAMLNTAWGCTSQSGEDVLLGNFQVTEAADLLNDCDVKIAVMHHDISSLVEYDRNAVRQPLMANFDLLLTGHVHGDDSNYVEIPSGNSIVRSGVAGITVNNNSESDEHYKNGFHVIDLNVNNPKDVAITKYVQNDNMDFVVDVSFGENGTWKPHSDNVYFDPLGQWIAKIKTKSDYLSNENINSFLKDLQNPNFQIIKVIAFSGFGKTRMIYEAFKNSKSLEHCYYCNAINGFNLNLLKQFNTLADKLYETKSLIIIDNCNKELQYRLLQDIKNYSYSNLRLIITSNEVNEYDREANIHEIRLNREILRDEVNNYIDEHIPEGSLTNRDKIKLIADGFPCMSISLVEEFQKENKIDIHTVDTLVKRMVTHDSGLDSNQQMALQTLSLFQPFPYNRGNHPVCKYVIGSSIFFPVDSTDNSYRQHIVDSTINKCNGTFVEVGLDYINVRPYPLAIWYVNQWFMSCGNQLDELIKYVESLPEQDRYLLEECLCKRMETIKDSPYARKLVEQWVHKSSFLNEKVILSDMGSRLFLAMSHVNPIAIAEKLYDFFKGKEVAWIRENVTGNIRRNYVNTIEKLCFSRESYQQGALLLAKFSLAENENWGNNSTGQFVQLFNILLPGTEVNYVIRIQTLKSLYSLGIQYDYLVLKALEAAFNSNSFTRMNGAEQFGLESKQDYVPTSKEEVLSYRMACKDLMIDLMKRDEKCIEQASKIVENHTYSWLQSKLLFKKVFLSLVYNRLSCRKDWLKLYEILFDITLQQNFDVEFSEIKTDIYSLINRLRPNAFANRFYEASVIVQMEMDPSSEKSIIKLNDVYDKIVRDFVSEEIFAQYHEVEEILKLDFYIHSLFFTKLSKMMSEEALNILYSNILTVVKMAKDNSQYKRLYQFVGGLSQRAETNLFLDKIYQLGYRKLFVELLAVSEDSGLSHFRKINELILTQQMENTVLTTYLSHFNMMTQEQAVVLLTFLDKYIKIYPKEIFSFIQKFRYLFKPLMEKNVQVNSFLKKILLEYPVKNEKSQVSYWYSNTIASILKSSHDKEFARQINLKLMEEDNVVFDSMIINSIYKVLLSNEYIDCIWSDFSRAFYDDKYLVFFMSIRLEIGSGLGFGNGLLFSGHNEERVKKLCLRFPDTVPHKIAEIAPCFEYEESDGSKKVVGFNHILIWLIDSFTADKSLLSSIHANIHSFQWTGSLIPYFTRNIFCFKKLLSHPNQNVQNWAKECIETEQRELEQEQKREEFEAMHYNV